MADPAYTLARFDLWQSTGGDSLLTDALEAAHTVGGDIAVAASQRLGVNAALAFDQQLGGRAAMLFRQRFFAIASGHQDDGNES